ALLALLALGFKQIRLGPTLPAFLSPGVAKVLGLRTAFVDIKRKRLRADSAAFQTNGLCKRRETIVSKHQRYERQKYKRQ
ncbi:MAG: hypothetical protein EOM73_06665, partial [Bacteroidia bacterium]|nr:hypothetical protein [Bacteroidia bacterium]